MYKWAVVWLLFAAAFLNLEDRTVIFSVLPLIDNDLKLTKLESAWLMPAFLWVYAAFSPFAGWMGDRWSRRDILCWCLLGWSAVTLLCALAANGAHLIALRAVLGVTQACYIPVAYAILADTHARETRGRASAILHAGGALGPIIGGTLAAWLSQTYGWRPTLAVLGAVGIVLGIACRLYIREIRVGGSENSAAGSAGWLDTSRAVLRTPTFYCLLAASGSAAVAVWMLITWLPVFLFDEYTMQLTKSALLGHLTSSGPILPGFVIGGLLSDAIARTDPRRRLLIVTVCFAAAAPFPLLFWFASDWPLVLAGAAAFLFFRAMGESNWHPVLYEISPPAQRSTAVGIANSFNTLMGGAGALIAGFWRDRFGLQMLFGLVSILILLAAGALFLGYRVYFERDRQRLRRASA